MTRSVDPPKTTQHTKYPAIPEAGRTEPHETPHDQPLHDDERLNLILRRILDQFEALAS